MNIYTLKHKYSGIDLHKSKVIIGIVIIVIGISYFGYTVSGMVVNESLYQRCVQLHESPQSKDHFTCPHFTTHYVFYVIGISIAAIGGLLVVLGLKSVSLL